MEIFIIFGVGVFISLLSFGGLFYTVREIRQMGNQPEKYRPQPSRVFFR